MSAGCAGTSAFVNGWAKRLWAVGLAVVCCAAPSLALAQQWEYLPPEDGYGPASAYVGDYPDFSLSLGCAGRNEEAAARGGIREEMSLMELGAPAPLLLFAPAQGFVRDLNIDLDGLGAVDVQFVVDGRSAGRVAFEYRERTGEFVGAIEHNGPLIEAMQAGYLLELRAVNFDAYGAAPLDGSRRAIDQLRAYCPDMEPSRTRRRGSRSFGLGAFQIEVPVGSGGQAALRFRLPTR